MKLQDISMVPVTGQVGSRKMDLTEDILYLSADI